MRTPTARKIGLLTILCTLGLIAATPGVASAQLLRRWFQPCVPCPTAPSTGAAAQPGAAEAGAPGVSGSGAQPGAGAETPAPSDLFAQAGAGAASGPQSAAPFMIGDLLGGFATVQTGSGQFTQVPLPGGAISRFKMAENTSPLPTDRVYFDCDSYHNVPVNNGVDVNAFVSGFEKTFLEGALSLELRLPMANTLDHTVYLAGPTGNDTEFGDIGMAIKAVLLGYDTLVVSGGLALTVPTAHDTTVYPFDTPALSTTIQNQSVHLLPFVGGLWTPGPRLFALGYLQVDVDTNGDPVFSNRGIGNGGTTTNVGRYYEQTLLYVDGSLGYWLRHDEDCQRLLTGVALVGELHLNQSLSTPQGLPSLMSGGNISILDMTVGTDLQFGPLTTVTAAYCTPLTDQRQFDGQFRLLINRRF